MRIKHVALATAALLAGPGAGHAAAGTFICVPATAGAALTSGGSSGSCSAGTPVELPTSRAEQQAMLSVLPYLSFQPSGVGGRPTITVTGANLQLKNRAGGDTPDGTGNLVVGHNRFAGTQTGSHAVAIGDGHAFSGVNALIAGGSNRASANNSVLFGSGNAALTGGSSVLGGMGNTANGGGSAILGGHGNRTDGSYTTVVGGSSTGVSATYGIGGVKQPPTRTFAFRIEKTDSSTSKPGATAISTWSFSGGAWIYVPDIDIRQCTVTATPVDAPAGTIVRRSQARAYSQWILLHTTIGTADTHTALDVKVTCAA